jgi:cytochrome c oxidase assembly factor CtaG
VQARRDGPDLDPEYLGDPPVVEVGVVAEEEREPLTLRERRDQRCQLRRLGLGSAAICGRRGSDSWLAHVRPPLLPRRIDDGPPGPSLERRLAPEVAAAADERGEGVLDGLARILTLTDDRGRDGDEVGEARAIERLDLCEQLLVRRRHSGDSILARGGLLSPWHDLPVSPYEWSLDWDTAVVVPLLAASYAVAARRWPPSRERRAAFAASLLLMLAVLVTPVETIALHYLLSAHLLQNVVLAEWAPGLAVLGVAPALARELEGFPLVRALTHPLVALPLWLLSSYAWHAPTLYDTALEHQESVLHLEHASFFATGVALWWPVVHGKLNDGAKALYVFTAFVLASPLGLLLALLPTTVYDFYERAPHLWGLGHLTDQQIAGVTMAVEQAIVFFVVFAFFLGRFLRSEELAGVFSGSRR